MTDIDCERRRLMSEANKMLVGAEKMMRLVHNALEFGPNSILEQSYNVKSRVKTPKSLVQKVLSKRADGEEGYTLDSVTDIVGFRFLALFKQDLALLASSFVEFLNKFHGEPTSILFGDTLFEGVKEVIVYKTKVSEESYDAIVSQLRSSFARHGFPDGFVKEDSKDTKYSSIHIVVNGLVYTGGQAKTIPVEFQLRTVFEDIWSEVEHRLVYKNHLLQNTENGEQNKKLGELLMTALKDQLDVGSEAADRAYFELLFEDTVETTKGSASSRALLVLESIQDILPDGAEKAITELREQIISTYEVLADLSSVDNATSAANGFKAIRAAVKKFNEDWSDSCIQSEECVSRFRYMVDMEIAASYFWEGQLATRKKGDATYRFEENASKEAQEFFEKARKIYFDIASMPRYADDPILNLRIGEIFRNTRQLKPAQIHFETARDAMEQGDWVGKSSIFESIIPRHLGYLYWLQSMELSQAYSDPGNDGQNEGSPNPTPHAVKEQILSKLAKAFSETFGLDQLDIKELDKERSDPKKERSIAYNNAMSYALEYIDRGGSDEQLNKISKNGFDRDFYKRFYKYYDPEGPSDIDIRIVETGLNAALLFDDPIKGRAWLKLALAWLQAKHESSPAGGGARKDVLHRRVQRAVDKASDAWDTSV